MTHYFLCIMKLYFVRKFNNYTSNRLSLLKIFKTRPISSEFDHIEKSNCNSLLIMEKRTDKINKHKQHCNTQKERWL